MTLPASGLITMANVNQELRRASPYNQAISMNDTAVRTLAGAPSGVYWMSNLHGKQYRIIVNLTVGSPTYNYHIFNNRGGSYVAGITDVIFTNNGTLMGSTSTAAYSLDTGTGWTSGDTVQIVNTGGIAGKGGDGNSGAGGPAINLQWPTSIINFGNIFSGGGSGGYGYYPDYNEYQGGGGGAGMDVGLGGYSDYYSNGSDGTFYNGGAGSNSVAAGGTLNVNGANAPAAYPGHGGGGGGGGASGGFGYIFPSGYNPGGGHGLAIQRNGNTLTWPGSVGGVYGGIS